MRGEAAARASGHRAVPHTADVAVEAWAPTFGECLGQAVAGVVESFADIAAHDGAAVVTFDVAAGDPADVLAAVLDELIYHVDVDGRVPMTGEVTGEAGRGVHVRWQMADPDAVDLVGAVPKAVSLHDLVIEPRGTGWHCHVLLDV